MAVDSDHLVELVLQSSWDRVRAGGIEAWRRTQDYSFYDQEAVDSVFNRLQAVGGIRVRSADIPLVENHNAAVLGVGLSQEGEYKSFLAQGYERRGPVTGPSGETMRGSRYQFVREAIVAIYVIAPTKDMVRMMSRFVKTAIISHTPWFLQQGEDSSPTYKGSADLEPVASTVGQESILRFVRRMHYAVKAVERLTPLDIAPYPNKVPLVYAEGEVVSSLPDPETRTFTPLTPISIGKVRGVVAPDT